MVHRRYLCGLLLSPIQGEPFRLLPLCLQWAASMSGTGPQACGQSTVKFCTDLLEVGVIWHSLAGCSAVQMLAMHVYSVVLQDAQAPVLRGVC